MRRAVICTDEGISHISKCLMRCAVIFGTDEGISLVAINPDSTERHHCSQSDSHAETTQYVLPYLQKHVIHIEGRV